MKMLLNTIIACCMTMAVAVTAQDIAPPPDADAAEAALKNSPRHGEFVFIDLPGSDEKIKTWVVYPERSDKAPVILVIHEIFGMTDWANSVADHLASQGFIAVAPDMIYGLDGDENDMTKVRNLPIEERIRRLNAARDYALKLPAANGKVGSIGFCWGGSTSFLYAVNQPDLNAAVVGIVWLVHMTKNQQPNASRTLQSLQQLVRENHLFTFFSTIKINHSRFGDPQYPRQKWSL